MENYMTKVKFEGINSDFNLYLKRLIAYKEKELNNISELMRDETDVESMFELSNDWYTAHIALNQIYRIQEDYVAWLNNKLDVNQLVPDIQVVSKYGH